MLLLLPNLPEYPVFLLAAIAEGVIITTASPLLTTRDLDAQIADSGARLIVTLASLIGVQQPIESAPLLPLSWLSPPVCFFVRVQPRVHMCIYSYAFCLSDISTFVTARACECACIVSGGPVSVTTNSPPVTRR